MAKAIKLNKKQTTIKNNLKIAIINKVKGEETTQEVIDKLVQTSEGLQILKELGNDFIDTTAEWKTLKTQTTNAFKKIKLSFTINKVKNSEGNKQAEIEQKGEQPKSLQKAKEEKAKEKEEELFFTFVEWFEQQPAEVRAYSLDDLHKIDEREKANEKKAIKQAKQKQRKVA